MQTRTQLELKICTLADLIEACQTIRDEVGRCIMPSEIRIHSKFNHIYLSVNAETASDGHVTYAVEVW